MRTAGSKLAFALLTIALASSASVVCIFFPGDRPSPTDTASTQPMPPGGVE